MEYLITFGSTHKALKAEEILKKGNIPFKLMPTPKKLALFCDLSILFEEDFKESVECILKKSGVNISALYRKEGDEYVKVQLLR